MNNIYWLISRYEYDDPTWYSESEYYWLDIDANPDRIFEKGEYLADINGAWEEYGKYQTEAEAREEWNELEQLNRDGAFFHEHIANHNGKWVVEWRTEIYKLERIEEDETDPDDVTFDRLAELAPSYKHNGTHLFIRKLTFKNTQDSMRCLSIDDYTGVDDRDIYLMDNREKAEIETLAEFEITEPKKAEQLFETCCEREGIKQSSPYAPDLIVLTLEEESRDYSDRDYVDSTIIYRGICANK